MPLDDLKSYAMSDIDFYSLLGITLETSQKDIDRAWRKTALKYHPDKVGNDPVAKEKFHQAQIGYDLLSDPVIKALYDSARYARLQSERRYAKFVGDKKKLVDDLLAKEGGVKRERDEELKSNVERLGEDGKKRRMKKEDALREDRQQKAEQAGFTEKASQQNIQSSVSDMDKTVSVQWPLEGQPGETSSVGQEQIMRLFSRFGKIESADLLQRLVRNKKNKKQRLATCSVQYASVVGAHTAVENFPKQQGPEWERFDNVFWAKNKEPDFIAALERPAAAVGSNPSAFNTPPASNSPSFEEITMIRLTIAERKRLADLGSASSPSMHSNGQGGASRTATFVDQGSNSSIRSSPPSPASWRKARGGDPSLPGEKPSFASLSSAAAPNTTPSSGKNGLGGFLNTPSQEETRRRNAERKRMMEEIQRQDDEEDAEEARRMN